MAAVRTIPADIRRAPSRALLTMLLASGLAIPAGCSQDAPAPSSSSVPAAQSSAPAAVPAAPGSDGNRPPTVTSAKLVYHGLTRDDSISVEVTALDPDGEQVMVRYQWLSNGVPIEDQTNAMLPLKSVRRGDRVSVEVKPVDARGAFGPPAQSDSVDVGNTPPVATRLKIEPEVASAGDVLHASVEAADPDGDPIRYVFKWWRNGEVIESAVKDEREKDQEQRTLSTDGFKRGDSIIVGVTPRDAGGPGRLLTAEPLVLSNKAPVITSTPAAPAGRGAYEYTVTAADPDGDTLTFALETVPSGMTIDAASGRIAWTIPPDLKEPQQVRVRVDDGHTGQAFQEFSLSPAPAAPAR
jgi:hypothetical protein